MLETIRSLIVGRSATLAPDLVESDVLAALHLAEVAGLGSLFADALAPIDPNLGAEVTARVRANRLAAELQADLQVEPVLHLALSTLADAGIEPIALKGIALAYGTYADPYWRAVSDIDLLIERSELADATTALRHAGFEADGPILPRGHQHSPALREPRYDLTVELHTDVVPDDCPYDLDPAALRARAKLIEIVSLQTRVLSPTDALIVACIHESWVHRYAWRPLRCLVDVLALTHRHAMEIDWEALMSRTRRAKADGAVYWPLWLSAMWLGAQVSRAALSDLAPHRGARWTIGAALSPCLLIRRQVPARSEDGTLIQLFVELSLLTGCPVSTQIGVLMRRLFAPVDSASQALATADHSCGARAARSGSLARASRGAAAFRRLVRRSATGGIEWTVAS